MSDDSLKKMIQLTKDVEHQNKIIKEALKLQEKGKELLNMELNDETLEGLHNFFKEMKFHREESKRWKEGIFKDRNDD